MNFKMLFRRLARPAAIAGFTLFAAPALAATAQVTADLNMRAGPSTRYPVITTVPYGHSVTVYGCLQGYSWCDVSWRGSRGWVSANYLNYRYADTWRPIPSWGTRIGVPLITFSFGDYSYRHYRNYDWYRYRDRWMDHRPPRHDRGRDWNDGRRGDRDGRWDRDGRGNRDGRWDRNGRTDRNDRIGRGGDGDRRDWRQWQQQQGGILGR
ncbi:MAG: SH3 domain-containing protein [Flavobacteriaceae bacterium]